MNEEKSVSPTFLVEYFDAQENATYLAPCNSIGECLKVIRQFSKTRTPHDRNLH